MTRLSPQNTSRTLIRRESWNWVWVLLIGMLTGVMIVGPIEVALTTSPLAMLRPRPMCGTTPEPTPFLAVEVGGGCNQALHAAIAPSDAVRFREDNPFVAYINGRSSGALSGHALRYWSRVLPLYQRHFGMWQNSSELVFVLEIGLENGGFVCCRGVR